MTNWQDIYQSKLTSVEDSVRLVSKRERVSTSFGMSSPVDLVNELSKRLPELEHITFIRLLFASF